MDKSEILVHISAPSGAADDARYRAQVEAILNFQSHSREIITLTADKAQSCSASSPPPSSTSPLLDATRPVNAPQCVPIRAPKRHVSQRDSLDSLVSVIPDSQPQQPDCVAESLHLTPYYYPSPKRPRVGSPSSPNRAQHDGSQGSNGGNHDSPANASPTIINTQTTSIATSEYEQENEAVRPLRVRKEENQLFKLPPLPLQIKPPPPPISSTPFTTHITPTLEMLTRRLKSPRTYSPIKKTRGLDSLERGYWYLRINLFHSPQETASSAMTNFDPRNWDTVLFSRFWTFLSEFIAKEGRAGWGVWCILEDENISPLQEADGVVEAKDVRRPHHSRADPISGPGDTHHLALKVYAWGEVVVHIYLLLYLASERRVRKMGAQWRDARDEVVIQMP
ncbi:uncharacterized protein BJX67DRAFT_355912 [Aspergillus lucknowensis]|uniref:Uncharacterized protein n=1 Tax=Aspergillus lucknowensis TaxID=176173 RepID=A0ABR4LPM2_9EURO